MSEETFLELIARAGITRDEAREAARATVRTLAERISAGEAMDLAAFLPGEFREILESAQQTAEPFVANEFVHRVAAREGSDGETAIRHVRAVFGALGQAVSLDALSNLAAQLSRDFDPLLEVARRRGDWATATARGAGHQVRVAGDSAGETGSGSHAGTTRAADLGSRNRGS